ncbi:N-acetyltransferase [Streptomyces sp. CS149]|uniref:GNAT family N-acetyltransferase n=3 Tax=Streptomyces TaxID=1883 RepID=A0ABY4V239_STRFL|nr:MULTISPECIES: GNAT family N-acetyltransferase [Streptomyces]MYV58494.1 GNAT family N-acetyltransferase [Streptomyces sp. SID4931]SCF63468.1 Protein N-acetyltransferase, RimJ/RimL family [Streptomyces sp. Ncost-T6T-2b]EFE73639.1 acetyltransferase [Streptomyces filamentosus NRRL 15998]ESU47112.1 putative acetyltransferase [Streptomyces sp. HCCB10043]EWS90826.1 acetyltransferase [Streptomyces filamentosus NRRL 11379]
MAEVSLRAVEDADLPLFFAWMSDPDATRVAAFTPKDPTDRAAFDAHWARIRSGSGGVVMRTAVADGVVVGHVGAYGEVGDRQVTYWIDRAHWGRGLATAALRAFLDETPTRPLHARAAADNLGSRRVLEKCGFVVTGTDRGFAQARGEEIDEVLVTLRA